MGFLSLKEQFYIVLRMNFGSRFCNAPLEESCTSSWIAPFLNLNYINSILKI